MLWAAKSPDELVDTVAACEALRSHLAAIEASALAEVEDRLGNSSQAALERQRAAQLSRH